jgi:hypothetical protein
MDNICAIQTLNNLELEPGDTITVADVSASFNGTFTVLSVEPYYFQSVDEYGYFIFDYDQIKENQIIYASNGADQEYTAQSGTVTRTVSVSWTTSALVQSFLGIDTASANDTAYIAKCVSASNAYCYRKRREAGYSTDSTSTVPSADVELGTTLYAAILYRERGTSGDQFASYPTMGQFDRPVTMGRVLQLLGCGRAQVA